METLKKFRIVEMAVGALAGMGAGTIAGTVVDHLFKVDGLNVPSLLLTALVSVVVSFLTVIYILSRRSR